MKEKMSIDEYWKKYNHCPKCRFYLMQSACGDCKHKYPVKVFEYPVDNFEPTEECIRSMNAEVSWERNKDARDVDA